MNVLHYFLEEIPHTFLEVFQSLFPVLVVFIFFQVTVLKIRHKNFIRILIGVFYALIGLLLFLVGINVGFMPAGNFLGSEIIAKSQYFLIPVGLLLGFVVVMAEPAVQVLNDQVYTVSGGNISRKAMLLTLSIGVGVAVALAMLRIIFDFSIWWYIIPGYLMAFILMKFTPPVFTAIAFDSGGVASGPMTATFILSFALGASEKLGRNVMSSAFGTVAMVALTPLIAIQIMGVIYGKSSQENVEDFNKLQTKIESGGDDIELYDDASAEIDLQDSALSEDSTSIQNPKNKSNGADEVNKYE